MCPYIHFMPAVKNDRTINTEYREQLHEADHCIDGRDCRCWRGGKHRRRLARIPRPEWGRDLVRQGRLADLEPRTEYQMENPSAEQRQQQPHCLQGEDLSHLRNRCGTAARAVLL